MKGKIWKEFFRLKWEEISTFFNENKVAIKYVYPIIGWGLFLVVTMIIMLQFSQNMAYSIHYSHSFTYH